MKKSTWYKILAIIPGLMIADGLWEGVGWPVGEIFLGVYLAIFIGFCAVCEFG